MFGFINFDFKFLTVSFKFASAEFYKIISGKLQAVAISARHVEVIL